MWMKIMALRRRKKDDLGGDQVINQLFLLLFNFFL